MTHLSLRSLRLAPLSLVAALALGASGCVVEAGFDGPGVVVYSDVAGLLGGGSRFPDQVKDVTGKCFAKKKESATCPASYDKSLQKRLWNETTTLLNLPSA